MVELLVEGLISEGLDSLERRAHARRTARYAATLGLRYNPIARAPHMAQAFGELGTGDLLNLLSGRIGGGEVVAWERIVRPPLGADPMDHYSRHPTGHFVAVPLSRPFPNVVVRAWQVLLTSDDCLWLPAATRLRLQDPNADRLFRVAATDHAFARNLIDEPALLRKPRRSWAVLGPWAVCMTPLPIRRRGKHSLTNELDFLRTLAVRLG
ncbi:hypothetical protein AB0A73_09775 [Glycomyces sp. NPDC047369]